MAKAKKAPKAEPTRKALPISPTGDPYGPDADKIEFARTPGQPDRQCSKRIGYFERQLQVFREEIEQLEDTALKPDPPQYLAKQYKDLEHKYALAQEDIKSLEMHMAAAVKTLHAHDLDCPGHTFDEDCTVCFERHEKEEEPAAETV